MAEGYDLTGTIDMHVHSAPDTVPRCVDDLQAAREAREAGMRAVALKSHVTCTADRAAISERSVGGIRVVGGVALNREVGGLNPAAVEAALQLGARVVWMPTRDAAHDRAGKGKAGGLSILDAEGRLRAEVREILDLLGAAGVALGTGHLSPAETVALARAAREQGLRRIVVTHPESPAVRMGADVQAELAGPGVFFERCALTARSAEGMAEVVGNIRRLGAASTVLSTDLGQQGLPTPVEGMRVFLARLAAVGFRGHEIRQMAAENPAYLLGA